MPGAVFGDGAVRRLAVETTLRLATASDVEFLYNLLKVALGPYVELVFGPWNEEEERAKFFEATRPGEHQIVERAGEPIGCLKVQRSSSEFKLNRVFLLPAFQGRGIGSELVRDLLIEAHSAGLPVRLRVFKINPARRLYERLGFVVTGETEFHVNMESTFLGSTKSDIVEVYPEK